MIMRKLTGAIMALMAAMAMCAPCAAQAQQPLAGPAAAVITTPSQQQALATLIQPRPIQPYTFVERQGRPLIVYESGHEFTMIPADDYIDELKKRGTIGNMSFEAEPDPAGLIDKDYSDMPPSSFVHVLDYLTPVRSQGRRGMCHAFAATAFLEALIKRRLMRHGVPEQLAEVDLSEEWFCYQSMKRKSEYYSVKELSDEGFFGYLDLEMAMDKSFATEMFWPYEPDSWPDTAGHPATIDWVLGEKCAWEWWGHREPAELAPSSIAPFREHASPHGPMLSVTVESSRFIGDPDEGFDLARTEISDGRPVMLSIVWPSMQLTNPQRTMYCVSDDYPFDALEAKLGDGEMTEEQIEAWDDAYGGGHEILLVGYGKAGSDCDGIWMVKNSHGLDSGNDGIVYITESLIRLSFADFAIARLTDDARSDIERFAQTMLEQLER